MRKLIVGILVLVVLLVVADRVAAALAARQVATEIAADQPDCSKPGVDIGGFPFLTQAVSGRYDDVRVTTSCRSSSGLSLAPVSVDLRGAHVGLGQIVHRQVNRVPVDHVSGSATVPYGELDQRLAGQSLRLSEGPDHTITVTGTLSVAGQSVSAHGTGAVSISGGDLQVSVRSVSTPAGQVDAGGAFDVSVPLPPLPFHLTGAGVAASPRGVVVSARASNVVLHR